MKFMTSPPTAKLRSGLRARRVNVAGACAASSSTKSGSSLTTFSSTLWPAARNSRSASGWWNAIPISPRSRRQPRSIVAIASSLRTS